MKKFIFFKKIHIFQKNSYFSKFLFLQWKHMPCVSDPVLTLSLVPPIVGCLHLQLLYPGVAQGPQQHDGVGQPPQARLHLLVPGGGQHRLGTGLRRATDGVGQGGGHLQRGKLVLTSLAWGKNGEMGNKSCVGEK